MKVGFDPLADVFYTAFKNLIAVVAQVNEALQQRKWMITPMTARVAATAAGASCRAPDPSDRPGQARRRIQPATLAMT